MICTYMYNDLEVPFPASNIALQEKKNISQHSFSPAPLFPFFSFIRPPRPFLHQLLFSFLLPPPPTAGINTTALIRDSFFPLFCLSTFHPFPSPIYKKKKKEEASPFSPFLLPPFFPLHFPLSTPPRSRTLKSPPTSRGGTSAPGRP